MTTFCQLNVVLQLNIAEKTMSQPSTSKPQLTEAVMLFDDQGIASEMLLTEFEAYIDNKIRVPQYEDQQVRAAYVLINPRLLVRAIVFFYLDFDDEGVIEDGWNLDLRLLAEKASHGPDLGAGPIQLACSSQCPIPWCQMHLWSPDLSPSSNHIYMIRDAARRNNLRLSVDDDAQSIIAADSFQVAEEDRWQSKEQVEELLRKTRENEQKERQKAAQIIKQQRLRISALEAMHTEAITKLRSELEQRLSNYEQNEQLLKTQLEQQQQQNLLLKQQFGEQVERVQRMRDDLQQRIHELNQQAERQNSLIKAQCEQEIQVRLNEATAHYQEQILNKDHQLANLHRQLEQSRKEQQLLASKLSDALDCGADPAVVKLEKSGISFVTALPGIGHIQIPRAELELYLQSPNNYAAKKCKVNPQQYLKWLEHYENPACNAMLPTTDTACGLPLDRKKHPAHFIAGESDRCSRHRKLI